MKIQQVSINTLKIEYIVEGKGEDILFLHGGSASFRTWIPFIEELAQCARVWAMSLPGAGKSSRLPKGWKFEDYAEVLKEFVESNDIIPTIIGHSFGGAISIHTVARYPKLFKNLVLFAPAGVASRKKSTKSSSLTVMKQQTHAFFFGNKYAKWDIRVNVLYHLFDMFKISSMFETLNIRDDLEKIDLKTTIVWGEHDEVLPIDALPVFEQKLKNAHSYIIKAGHGFLNDHKAEVVSILCKEFAS